MFVEKIIFLLFFSYNNWLQMINKTIDFKKWNNDSTNLFISQIFERNKNQFRDENKTINNRLHQITLFWIFTLAPTLNRHIARRSQRMKGERFPYFCSLQVKLFKYYKHAVASKKIVYTLFHSRFLLCCIYHIFELEKFTGNFTRNCAWDDVKVKMINSSLIDLRRDLLDRSLVFLMQIEAFETANRIPMRFAIWFFCNNRTRCETAKS